MIIIKVIIPVNILVNVKCLEKNFQEKPFSLCSFLEFDSLSLGVLMFTFNNINSINRVRINIELFI